ncbi:hypothetical protein [Streptomyces lancefieldiae]|uniref:Uncharacterized protein n=1 Tax=Streptomyces lancefieldiae TaxID=3075520 RepID=A0ABU3B065_9ACTN|nr:hypothetical protein [Streptomyces sp. DSM 40712]MDT0615836.1 hypothetical protein [Streptomyces sp. DSM 40712]
MVPVLAVKAVVLGGGAAAVCGVGHPFAAVGLAVVMLVNTAAIEISRRAGPDSDPDRLPGQGPEGAHT